MDNDTPLTTQRDIDRAWDLLLAALDRAGVPHDNWALVPGKYCAPRFEDRCWLIVSGADVVLDLGVSKASAYRALLGMRFGVKLAQEN
ncbi:hypothetical protein SEA_REDWATTLEHOG_186 [Gordonia phage RedWattleHog]|uniref:Uncharacterized protein n=1 Tax=Gordonia phage Stormageddon TaxID=2656541 RepID=A0A649VRB3_9CAUD|nr:hypothetical protein KHQ86_gp113 [Gordonia phage Stormageddon]QGJ95047.1 hypothetical protein SEA_STORMAGEDDON_187 [Gordonia phage Stormageddon]QLF83689.1 hypothetical protein SEA_REDWATTLEHOG_186 [Gordonia phage RedWattleHog]